MTALKRELTNRGILHEADDLACMRGAEYDTCERLVSITPLYIITVFHSAVLPSELRLYDRKTFRPIGGQNLIPERYIGTKGEWESYFWEVA